ncbi:MAG: hypothetical protein HYU97_12130 [Deltaproteobacteria bacterium]|nr:hypothetical protein [Deltaproteobacteria bacterium]
MGQPSSLPRSIKHEVARKLLHLPVFLFPWIATHSLVLFWAVGIGLILIYIGIYYLEIKLKVQVPLLTRLIHYCRRGPTLDWGPIYLMVGFLVASNLGPVKNLWFCAYIIAVCDSMASLVGKSLGGPRLGKLSKTYVGSAAFLMLALVGFIYFFSPGHAVGLAIVLTLVEMFSVHDLDNFTLPVSTALLLILK